MHYIYDSIGTCLDYGAYKCMYVCRELIFVNLDQFCRWKEKNQEGIWLQGTASTSDSKVSAKRWKVAS